MTIECVGAEARLADHVSVEDAETLLQWLQRQPSPRVDLAACVHLHAAVLQVLMASRPQVVTWPIQPMLCTWLQSALSTTSMKRDPHAQGDL